MNFTPLSENGAVAQWTGRPTPYRLSAARVGSNPVQRAGFFRFGRLTFFALIILYTSFALL